MGSAEAVEEMHERNPSADSRKMSHPGQIHDFLDTAGGQHGKAALTAVHDVRVIAEDGQGMGTDRPGCHMEHSGKAFARNPVKHGDHQHKSLGRRKAGCEGACLKSTVHGSRGAGLRLHLDELNGLAEYVLLSFG